MKLRAYKNRRVSDYKNRNAYIDAVYRANKKEIEKAYSYTDGVGNVYKPTNVKRMFKQSIKEYIDEGKNVKQALNALGRSTLFTQYKDIARENLAKRIKRDKNLRTKFRKLKGFNEAFDINRLQYRSSNNKSTIYVYNAGRYGEVIIQINRSPEEGAGASIDIFKNEGFIGPVRK